MRANGSHSSDSRCVSRASAFGRPAQMTFEVHEAVISVDAQDFRHVEMSGIQKLELASQVEIKKSLHRAVWRDDARLHNCVLQGLFHFRPMFVMPDLWSSGGEGKLFSGLCRIPRARVHDHIARFFRSKPDQILS